MTHELDLIVKSSACSLQPFDFNCCAAMAEKDKEEAGRAQAAQERTNMLNKLKKYEEATVSANEEILDMERQEQMLIEELKETQEIQRKAYEELEDALQEQDES